MHLPGYFDANATTPLFPAAREVFLNALDRHWHNPSSLYHEAGAARKALEDSREQLADLLGLDDPARLIFTSGATEANNLLLRHHAAVLPAPDSVLISTVEHPSLREPAARCFPGRVIEASPDPDALLEQIRASRPGLVSLMAANNETGLLHPWPELRSLCADLAIPFHTDAAQWIGKEPLTGLGTCGWITGSAHKFGGPKGAGFLVVPAGDTPLRGSFLGGPQEHGRRAGTENVPALLAMAAALAEAESLRGQTSSRGRDAFESQVTALLPGCRFLGAGLPRLWNTSLFVLPEFGNLKWLTRLSHLGFQVSTGSACSAGKGHPSRVLEAMGLDACDMGRVLRASALWQATPEHWLALASALHQVWLDLRHPSPSARQNRKSDRL